MFIVLVLDLLWCLVIQGSVQSLRVPPRDPLERGQFQLAQSTERLAAPDEPGLVLFLFNCLLRFGGGDVLLDSGVLVL